MTVPQYHVYVDWTQSGSFSTDEGGLVKSFTVRRGRPTLLYGNSGFRFVDTGTFTVKLDNSSRRYDPYNTDSELDGNIRPNRPFLLQARYDGQVYNLIRGWMRNIIPQGLEVAWLEGTDGMDWLNSHNAPDLAIQAAYTVAQAMAALLDGSGWDYQDTTGWTFPVQLGITSTLGEAAIDDDSDTMAYWWSQPEKSVWQNLQELAQAWGGDIFVSADGTVCYRSRRQTGASVASIAQSQLLKDIEQTQPWTEIRNDIRITAWPRQATDAQTDLWQLNDIPAIAAGASLTIWAEYQYEGTRCPASSITTPVENTDYEANAEAGGGGADKSAQIGIVMTDYATRAKLVITNNDAGTVYLTLMKLRGTGQYSFSGTASQFSSAGSQAEFELHSFDISSIWLQTTANATTIGDFILYELAGPRQGFTVKIEQRPDVQFSVDLFQQITLTVAKLGINGLAYTVTQIVHDWAAGCGVVTTWTLEPAYTNWTFPVLLGTTSFLGG